ncbi:MAG: PrsW family intramembrane metalloprotease [Leptospiraceae bacterium]|nr:PrsW family intramembrane metalloprotease [Leptospiraceae bacterium]
MDAVIILLSVLVSGAVWLRFLYQYDRIEPEPILVLLRVILIGGLVSTFIAGIINSTFSSVSGIPISASGLSFSNSIILSAFVGLNEEIVKAVVTVLLVRNLKDLDEPIDAVIYATAVGLGFSVFENFQYTQEHGLLNLFLRTGTAMPLHIGLAAIWGYKIAEVKFLNGKNYLDAMKPAVLIAGGLHGLYDFFQFYLSSNIYPLLIAVGFSYFLIRVIREKLDYLATQSPFLKAGTCSHCGTINPIDLKKCKNCGMNLIQEFYKICDDCFAKVPHTEKRCPDCDAEMN